MIIKNDEARVREQQAFDDAMVAAHKEFTANLKAFTAKLDCVKCGGQMGVVGYHSVMTSMAYPEHLLWRCKICGAQQYTKCKDAE